VLTLFIAYKQLKKELKRFPAWEGVGSVTLTPEGSTGCDGEGASSASEAAFTVALCRHLQTLDDMFIEKEEVSVIRLEVLEGEAQFAESVSRLQNVHRRSGGDTVTG
jgi:hypothetical protein